ncbi:MAG TPA: hypothetical protein VIJ48_06620, partial [Acidimicrobiia bacterium]
MKAKRIYTPTAIEEAPMPALPWVERQTIDRTLARDPSTGKSAPSPSPAVERSSVTIPQYSRRAIFAIWAAAALPMAALAWIVAPHMASS